MIEPPQWSKEQLTAARQRAVAAFRQERLYEPAARYEQQLATHKKQIASLLKSSGDLRDLSDERLTGILTDKAFLDAFRYLSGPPISKDDLEVLAEVESLAPTRLRGNPEYVERVARVVLESIDKHRFPWLAEDRPPRPAERSAAILASASLMAYQRLQTARRNTAQKEQEEKTRGMLLKVGYQEVAKRPIETLGQAPGNGEFCGECSFGTRKADFVVGLHDNRKLLIECKVSNSEVNSVKRLNNDAAVKAEVWRKDFGSRNVVPAAMLSGVYKLENLIEAQQRGLALFWSHEPDAFAAWLARVRRDRR